MYSKCIIPFSILFTAICFNTHSQNIKWPEEWPPGMSLKTSYCCGSKPESRTIFISLEGSYVEESTDEKPKRNIALSFSREELKELLNILKKNNVASIKTHPSTNASSKDGISVLSFSYAGKDYTTNINAQGELNANSKERFRIITSFVEKLVDKKLITTKIDFVFKFDRSIIQSGKDLHIRVENTNTNFVFKADRIPSSAVIDLLPVEHKIVVKLINPDQASTDNYVAEVNMKVDTRANKQVTLILEGTQLLYK